MEDLLIEAIRQVNKPVEKAKNARQHSVVLKMHPPATENFPLVESHIKPIMPGAEFYSVGDSIYLIGLYPERQDAARVERLVKDSFNKYDELLMEDLVEDDWLEDYLANKSLGIDIVMQDGWLTSKDGIDEYIEKEIQSNQQAHRYHAGLKISKDACIDYTHDDVINDVLGYAEKVFDNESYDKDQLTIAVSESLSKIDTFLEGKSMLPKHACQQTVFALDERVLLLADSLEMRGTRFLSIHQVMDKAASEVTHEDWISFSRIFSSNLAAFAPTLQFKTDAVNGDSYVDYGFLPFSKGSVQRDMNARLAPSNIRYSIDDQGSSLRKDLSGGFAAYYLEVMGAKHEKAFERALHEYSRDIKVQTFPADLQDMVDNTMPVPANPKKATPKLKG